MDENSHQYRLWILANYSLWINGQSCQIYWYVAIDFIEKASFLINKAYGDGLYDAERIYKKLWKISAISFGQIFMEKINGVS